MNKICTSLEQSKKLIELGIDVKTADMCWTNHLFNAFLSSWRIESTSPQEYKNLLDGFVVRGYLIEPAWSLSALLGLMPNGEKNDENYVCTESHSDFYICTYRNCWDGCIHSEYSEEELLDAVFEMVVWLKENRKI